MTPKLSVSQFVAIFNESMAMLYPSVNISGEIANFRVSKGAWVYFDLKDDSSSVKFFGSIRSLPGPLEDGINVEVVGQPRLHNLYGFSVNFISIAVAGEGSIAKAQALLAKKLEAEGLFSPERKRSLPYAPAKIGLITSVESAAYTDFIKIINHRWGNTEINIFDCLVQGTEAPSQIINAIETFNMLADPPEVLVIIRGGGSADDMQAFSHEQVVRSVSSSRVPTVVAIGHERDVSLAELAADLRASTPSNAAELLVPDKSSELTSLRQKSKYLSSSIATLFEQKTIENKQLDQHIERIMNTKIDQQISYLRSINTLVDALNPDLPLKKGFALVRDSKGKRVKRASELVTNDISIQFLDGKVIAWTKK